MKPGPEGPANGTVLELAPIEGRASRGRLCHAVLSRRVTRLASVARAPDSRFVVWCPTDRCLHQAPVCGRTWPIPRYSLRYWSTTASQL
ncbi:hypothetical protein [Ornithinimicrobium kibberense]|uniref:hypothetical protein n=1 Tax=Ornithinimicrobium kibberense TaxID=282060 RepID=UPI003613271B